jgi:hypothetical protein
VLNVLAMAAAYSPNPEVEPHRSDLPFDLETHELRPEVWDRWLAHDPVRIAPDHADGLRTLRLLFFDCGTRDEYNLHLGARILKRRFDALGVPHRHEEFDDGHMSITYRYDRVLPLLTEAMERAR